MGAEAARRMSMINLRELVDHYLELAGHFGEPVALAAFGYSPEETGRLFTALDEDYHISRFLHFSRAEGTNFVVSGEPVTHLAIDPPIKSLL
jgi:hypothetical protein